jgi:hypothetical protein
MKNIKHYKSIVVSLALVAGLLISGSAFAAGAPTVTTVAVSSQDVSSTSAIIKATVFPNGADSQAWFKYSTNATLAGAIQPSCFPTVPGSVANQTVPCTISGLTPNTTYYFRAFASNQYGPAAQAQVYSFTTTSGGGSGNGTTGNGTCAINTFNVPTTAQVGQNVTISWDTSNCTTVTLSGGGLSNAAQNVDGQVTIIPSANGTYTFTLKANGTVTAVRTMTVGNGGSGTGNGNCVIYNFKLNGTNNSTTLTYQSGMQVLLSWQTNSGCTGVTVSGGGLPTTTHPATGQFYIAPSAPGNYTFTLTAQGGSNPTAVRVLTLTGGGGGTGGTTGGGNCHIDSFTTYSSQINSGSSTMLGWGTSNCSNVSISGIGSVSADGTTSTGALYGTTTFVLTASGTGGTVSSQVTVGIIAQTQYCDITNFSASSQNIQSGNAVTLTWNSQNCSTVSISGGSINGTYAANSSVTVYPTQTTSYTITGYGTGGWNDTAHVTVYVNQNQQQNYCQINYFNASQNSVSYGATATISWSTSNCTNVQVYGPGVSSSNTNGSLITAPIYTVGTYTITAYGTANGNQTQSTSVTANGNQQQQGQSCVITNLSANPSSVLRGSTTTLSWSTAGNCSYATVTNMSGYTSTVATNGSQSSGIMNVLGTRIFTLKAYATDGSVNTQTVSVLVYQNGTSQTTFACSDGYDNDGDGRTDGNDPGCASSTDNNEFNTTVINTGTTNGTGGVNGITISTNTADDYSTYRNQNLGGLALFSGVNLPGTLIGWLILLIIIVLIVLLLRSIIGYAPVHGAHGGHRPTGTDGHH